MQAKYYTPKQIVYLIIGLFFFFIFGYVCPTWSAVTPVGVKLVGVFLGWVFMMISGFGLMIPSLLAFLSMLLTGFYAPTDVMAGFANSVPLQCMFGMALIYAFSQTKGDEVVVRYLISRKFLNRHPVRFLLMFNLAITLISVFMDVGGMLLGFAFVNSIAAVLGYEEDSNWKRFMLTTVLVLSMGATNVLPFKPGALLTLGAFNGALGESASLINSTKYIIITLINVFLLAVALALLTKPLFRIDLSKMKELDVEQLVTGADSVRLNRKQAISGVVMLVGFLFPVVQMLFPADSGIYVWMNGFGQIFFMAFLLAVLEIIRVDGQPICKAADAFSKGILWDVIIAIIAIVLISGAMSNDASGIGLWIGAIFGELLGNTSFPILLLMITVLCGVVTQIFSNTATMVIVSTVLAQFLIPLAESGVDITVFPAIIAQVSQIGVLTPAASGFAAMLLGLPALQAQPKWIFKSGTVVMLVYIVIAVPVGVLWGYIL